jgi:hypothetical protein
VEEEVPCEVTTPGFESVVIETVEFASAAIHSTADAVARLNSSMYIRSSVAIFVRTATVLFRRSWRYCSLRSTTDPA